MDGQSYSSLVDSLLPPLGPVITMRTYYFDNLPGDQRLRHDSGRSINPDHLCKLGVIHRTIPLAQGNPGGWELEIDAIAEQEGYKNRDIMNVTREALGDQYESKLKSFFEE
jgi:1,2-dihydroxy-3-keto-5-methylthiopentene dioxygenase